MKNKKDKNINEISRDSAGSFDEFLFKKMEIV